MPDIRYKRLFETIHIGILILDFKDRSITDVNPFLARLSGYTKKQLIGKKISEVKLFDHTLTGHGIFSDLKKSTEVIYSDVLLVTKDKQIRTVEVGAHTYKERGKTMVQCTVRDHTEKRKAQRDLFETNQRLQALLNALPVGVAFSLDPKGEQITANPFLSKKMELVDKSNISQSTKDPKAAGKKYRHYMAGRLLSAKELPIQRAITENDIVGPLEIELVTPNGKRWLMEAMSAPVRDKRGSVIGAVAVNVDLTERKKAEEAERLSRIIEQEKMKLDFIADATHELRTPLAIIRGNVDLALQKKSVMEDALAAINVEVIHLTSLLSDLALLTTKETDFRRKLKEHKVVVGKLVADVAKRHEGIAHKKNIKIHIGKMPTEKIIGDDYYLERLFTNLISNAISYGKENGNIWVKSSADKKCIRFIVEDDGIGITEKDLPHIFERFYRADSSRSKDYGGSGLGLAIVKWIAEAHGGSVLVESEVGKGSTFAIGFPLPGNTTTCNYPFGRPSS